MSPTCINLKGSASFNFVPQASLLPHPRHGSNPEANTAVGKINHCISQVKLSYAAITNQSQILVALFNKELFLILTTGRPAGPSALPRELLKKLVIAALSCCIPSLWNMWSLVTIVEEECRLYPASAQEWLMSFPSHFIIQNCKRIGKDKEESRIFDKPYCLC